MNWLQKLSQNYLHDEPNHNYEISWDHEIDEAVPDEIRRMVLKFQSELSSDLLSKLGVFRAFKIEFVNSLHYQSLATYINGTYSSPVIALDVGNIQAACQNAGEECFRAIKMSILHELAHAIQESKGLPFDEDEAEMFASNYYYYGQIYKI